MQVAYDCKKNQKIYEGNKKEKRITYNSPNIEKNLTYVFQIMYTHYIYSRSSLATHSCEHLFITPESASTVLQRSFSDPCRASGSGLGSLCHGQASCRGSWGMEWAGARSAVSGVCTEVGRSQASHLTLLTLLNLGLFSLCKIKKTESTKLSYFRV